MSNSNTTLTNTEIDQLQTAMEVCEETGASEYPIRIWQLKRLINMARNCNPSKKQNTERSETGSTPPRAPEDWDGCKL